MKPSCFLVIVLITGLLTARAAVLDKNRDRDPETAHGCPNNVLECSLHCETEGFAYGTCTGPIFQQECRCFAS